MLNKVITRKTMGFPNFIKKYYAFNLFNRDEWVKNQSKKIGNGLKVLDVGAGSAPYRQLFSHCDYKTHDFSQLKDDQLRGLKGYHSIDFVSDINALPIESKSFDVVLCTEVIEHVPEPIEALKEISRVLKVNGTLLLTAPLGSGLHQEPFHFYGGYTPYWYSKFLKENGFSAIKVQPNMGFYSFFGQEFIRFILRIAPWKGLANFLLSPLWLFLLPPALIIPLLAPVLDHLDKKNDFTIGYHIIAKKVI